MKIEFLFSGVFWGILLIILGISAISKAVFNINLPFFRITFALIIIYIGLCVLLNGFYFEREDNTVLFGDRHISTVDTTADNLNVIFGRGMLDLSNLTLTDGANRKEVNVIFGQGDIMINPSMPIKVVVTSAFGSAHVPDDNEVSFGKYTYVTPAVKPGEKFLEIQANVVFGQLNIINK